MEKITVLLPKNTDTEELSQCLEIINTQKTQDSDYFKTKIVNFKHEIRKEVIRGSFGPGDIIDAQVFSEALEGIHRLVIPETTDQFLFQEAAQLAERFNFRFSTHILDTIKDKKLDSSRAEEQYLAVFLGGDAVSARKIVENSFQITPNLVQGLHIFSIYLYAVNKKPRKYNLGIVTDAGLLVLRQDKEGGKGVLELYGYFGYKKMKEISWLYIRNYRQDNS